MKIALCLHGYMENSGGLSAFHHAFEYINKKILLNNQVDIFTHSWDTKNIQDYNNLYGSLTKDKIFEEQIDFSRQEICKNQEWFDEGINRNSLGDLKNNVISRTLSFLYSRKKVIDIKNNFETENDFQYDCTILARFDLGTRGKHCPQKYYATNFNLLLDSDMNNLHCAFWDQFNHGIPDHWFYSNSCNMTIVGNLYDFMFDYYQKNSDYVNSCLNGWVESNAEEEFSNEMLKEKNNQSKNLLKWPRHLCIDNHKLYKWHFHIHKIPLTLVDITKDL
tara:strand:- start:12570 stop:13400 length:831 start_codon:yes stop_codon:yes gene_type:complete